MIFGDLVTGDSTFVDANTLVYHFEPHPHYGSACTTLVQRIELQDIVGFTSTHVLSEVAHRLMTLESIKRFGWPVTGIAQRLRTHPAAVQQLVDFRQALDSIPNLRIQVLLIAPPMIAAAAAVSQQTGLLSNDALVVTVMQANGLDKLASNDADFDRVTGLTRYAPL
jgi:predicted nucleic acid-binding protein